MSNTVRRTTEEERLRLALSEREAELKLLLETSQALSMEMDITRLLQIIADKVRNFSHCRSVLIPILNPECTEYIYRAGSGDNVGEIVGQSLPIEYGVCGWVWRNKQPWWNGVIHQLPEEERLRWENQAHNQVMVPLIGKKHFLGGIACMNKIDGTAFNQRDLELLMLFANQAAIAVENAMLYAELQELNSSLEKRVEQRTSELQELYREMEAFSYSVSHDLRAPLRSISGFSQAVVEDYSQQLPPEGRDYLLRVSSSAEKMQKLIEALLKMSRLRNRPVNKQTLNLSEMALEFVEELRNQYPDETIHLTLRGDVAAQGDPELLRIVLFNLLSNAVKFSSQQPVTKIEFGIREQPAEWVYFVRDNGIGFDMAHAEHLFTPFQRLHSDSQFEGTGIGLATVARIIQRHGGRIWADSAPGEGACFYFTLP